MELGVYAPGVGPLALQACGAEIAPDPLEVAVVQRVVVQPVHEDVRPHLGRAPGADGIEIDLVRNERVLGDEPDLGAGERFQPPVPFDGDRPLGEIGVDDVGHGTELAGLAAPAEILGGGSERIHVVPEPRASACLMHLQTAGAGESRHVLQRLRELQPGIDVDQLHVLGGLGRESVCGEGVLPSGEGDGHGQVLLVALVQEPPDLPDSRPLDPLDVTAVGLHERPQIGLGGEGHARRGVEVAYPDGPLRLPDGLAVLQSRPRTDLPSLLQYQRVALREIPLCGGDVRSWHDLPLEMSGHACERDNIPRRDGGEQLRPWLLQIEHQTVGTEVVAHDRDHGTVRDYLVGAVLPRDLVEEERLPAEGGIGPERLPEEREDDPDAVTHARTDVPGAVHPELPALGTACGAGIPEQQRAARIAPSQILLPVSRVRHPSYLFGRESPTFIRYE